MALARYEETYPRTQIKLDDYTLYNVQDADLVVSNLTLEETINWYSKEFCEISKDDIEIKDPHSVKITIEQDNGKLESYLICDYIAANKNNIEVPCIIASSEY